MTPVQAEKLQDEIYRRMSPSKKLKILGQFYFLGKKLDLLKYGNREPGRAFTPEGNKQLEDIKSILRIAQPDLNYIKKWAAKTSTTEILEEIVREQSNAD